MRGLIYSHGDAVRATETRIFRDSETGMPLILRYQDVRRIITDAALARARFDRLAPRRHMHQIAEVPMVIYEQQHKLGRTADRKEWLKWLSRRDAQAFRTDDGRRLA
jgi:hypothetical protein